MSSMMKEIEKEEFFFKMVADIVIAYSHNNRLTVEDLTSLISEVFHLVQKLREEDKNTREGLIKPAVAPEDSVHDDYIICLEDGKKYKSLKRHLMAAYGLTAEAYRMKWNLPPDYPMVARNYAKKRSYLAKKIALGANRYAVANRS